MPLPYMSSTLIDSSVRNTEYDWNEVARVSGLMSNSNNSVMSTIGRSCHSHLQFLVKNKKVIRNEDFLFVCKLSEEDQSIVAIDGPQRKRFISKNSKKHIEAEKKHDGYSLDPSVDVSAMLPISQLFSEKNNIDQSGIQLRDMAAMSQSSGFGLNYVKICQSVFREININAMRGDRRRRFIIKPTGANGIFICLHPGPKLRCGELVNICWFCIIMENSSIGNDTLSYHWMFKRVTKDTTITYSRWLSIDVHRLDHYIRCYDKILMAYTSLLCQKYKSDPDVIAYNQSLNDKNEEKTLVDDDELEPISHTLLNYFNKDKSNTLGLIIMIYMENKRSTSKMLQNIRYLVMTSVSICPKFSSVMDKFKEPIRSPLQLYLLNKSINFVRKVKNLKIPEFVKFGPVKYDSRSHVFLDSQGGSIILLPRPIIDDMDKKADFSEILCEMYFTMLFNKNQDDPTHASFQILDKIIEGEENFQHVKKKNLHLGYSQDKTDIEFAKIILQEKRCHMFSRRAIIIGSKLLRVHVDDPSGLHYSDAVSKKNTDKTIDDFATFKSSSMFSTQIYNPISNVQNPRRRCIEGVIELVNQGCFNSTDVARKYKDEDTYYQVFKKNQIGGVREILILPITNRIRINIMETISRNLCSKDQREVLTHGVIKNESIKGILYSSKKFDGPRAPFHFTFDKSKWGPSFVPIQFIYMFSAYKDKMLTYFNFIVDLMIRHQNKKCFLPDRLIKAWIQHADKKHNYPGLQKLKDKFLKDHSLTMINESNMGQGILH
jgi:hypothetical protein